MTKGPAASRRPVCPSCCVCAILPVMVAATDSYTRTRLWQPGEAPLPEHAGRAYPLAKDFGGGRSALGLLTADAILRDGIDESAMSFPAVISDVTQDRVLDEVVPEGGDFSEFALSPSVFYGHQEVAGLMLPIGQARNPVTGELQIAVEPGRRILSRCFVARKGRWAQTAEDIFHLIVEGVLCGISIGFNAKEGGVERLPSGGNRYTRWSLIEWSAVGTACNARCTVVRSYLERGRITGKRINPALRKALLPLAAPRLPQAHGWTPETKALDAQGGEEPAVNPQALAAADFVTFPRGVDATCATCQFNENGICQHDGIKGQPVTDRNCCSYWNAPGTLRDWETDMSKKTRTPKAKKDMSESSGATGGYTVPEEKPTETPDRTEMKAAIRRVMKDHEPTAPDAGPHDAYLHEEKGVAYHHHAEDASQEHLKAVESGLATVPGVEGVAQSPEAPAETEGYTKVFTKGESMGEEGEEAAEQDEGRPETPEAKAQAEDEDETMTKAAAVAIRKAERKALALARLEAKGRAFMAARKYLPPKRRAALEDCVQRKIPKIAEDHPEMGPKQREAVAFAMCGEGKAFDSSDDYEHKDDLAAADMDPVQEEEHTDHPHGAQLAGNVIDTLQSGIQQLEPECREFFEDLLEEVRGWAEERYPDADFAGDEDTETDEEKSEEAEETEEALDRYRNPEPPKQTKPTRHKTARSHLAVLKSLGKKALGCLKAAADDMHEVGRLDGKSFTPRHAKRLVEHARNLDAIHGAASGMDEKDEEPEAKPEPKPEAALADAETKAAQALLRAFGDLDVKLSKVNDGLYGMTGKRCF